MSLTDTFSALGQQFQQALLKIYEPEVGGQTSLIFVPGGVPVSTSDGLTEPGPTGQLMVNPAQLTAWLETVVDSPLQIDIPNAALLGSTVTLVSMSAIFQTIAQFAVPSADLGSPAAVRVAQEISSAAADIGPGVLPISTMPPDWPLPDSTGWNTFESQQTTDTEAQSGGTTPPKPRIWQLRELPQVYEVALAAPDAATGPVPASLASPAEPAAGLGASSVALTPDTVSPGTVRPGAASPGAAVVDTVAEPVSALSGDAVLPPAPVLAGRRFLAVARAFALSSAQSSPVTTTQQSVSVTMSVDHMIATVNRSAWWQGNLIADPGWYIPGVPRGLYVGQAADPVNQPYALPVAIVLAKNLSISGTWSTQDASSLVGSGVAFGPFGLSAAEVTSTSQVTTISVPGVSLIAMFCEPLPVLPPNDPPAPSSSGSATDTNGSSAGSG